VSSKNIDTLTKKESLAAYTAAQCWEEQQRRPTSAAAGIDGSPILSDFGKIYVLDGTLSHISHKTFFLRHKGEQNKFRTRVRYPRGLLRTKRGHLKSH